MGLKVGERTGQKYLRKTEVNKVSLREKKRETERKISEKGRKEKIFPLSFKERKPF